MMISSAISESANEVIIEEIEEERLSLEQVFSLESRRLKKLFDTESELPADDHRQLRFWEVEAFFKCPVAGWCLDLQEQKRILQKEGIRTKGLSDLEMHEALVKSLDSENSLSRRIDFWLNRKYQKEISTLSSLEPEAFIKRWNASVKKEGFDGIVWVAVTRGDLSAEVRRNMFGDVHMETHVRAKQLDKERQRVDQEQKRSARFAKNANEGRRINRILKRENERLENQLSAACRLSEDLQNQNRKLENELAKGKKNSLIVSLQEENTLLRAEKDEVLEQILSYQRELRRLEKKNHRLLSRLKKQRQICFQRFNESTNPTVQALNSSPHDSASSMDLSKRCILVVGGLPKMQVLYRQLIERNKGTFAYHDGRMNKGTGPKDLVNKVRRADLAICCVDHSSHTSALVVKSLCKRHKKCFRMLTNSSLNNISLTLSAFQNTSTLVQTNRD